MILNVCTEFADVVDVWQRRLVNFADVLMNVLLNSVVVHLKSGVETDFWQFLPWTQARLVSRQAWMNTAGDITLVFILLEI